MLGAVREKLERTRVVLASGSPRRREILSMLLLSTTQAKLEVIPSSFAEDIPKDSVKNPSQYAKETALAKGLEVLSRLGDDDALIISADTVVVSPSGTILEKPADAKSATEMLSSLSGNDHHVITGVALLSNSRGNVTFEETTRVSFSCLSQDDIAAYVASGEPFDKAGGYGIQTAAGSFVCRIDGDYWNVVGLPQNRLCRELQAYLR